MNLNLSNPTTISILQSLVNQLDLPIETIIELVLAYADIDKVLSVGKQLKLESINDNQS